MMNFEINEVENGYILYVTDTNEKGETKKLVFEMLSSMQLHIGKLMEEKYGKNDRKRFDFSVGGTASL